MHVPRRIRTNLLVRSGVESGSGSQASSSVVVLVDVMKMGTVVVLNWKALPSVARYATSVEVLLEEVCISDGNAT